MTEPRIFVGYLEPLLHELRPDDTLVTNRVGNLSVLRKGEYVAYIDFRTMRVKWVIEEEATDENTDN